MTDDANKPVSRLPRLADPPADPVLREMFALTRARGGQPLNLHLTIGHAPKIAEATQALAYAFRFDGVTTRRERELTIMRTAQIVGSAYELAQHTPLALACGLSQAQLDGLEHWRDGGLFTEKEQALLAYVEQVAHGGDVDDATFAAFSRFYDPQETIELTLLVGTYYSTGLLTRALRIEIETDGRVPAPGKF